MIFFVVLYPPIHLPYVLVVTWKILSILVIRQNNRYYVLICVGLGSEVDCFPYNSNDAIQVPKKKTSVCKRRRRIALVHMKFPSNAINIMLVAKVLVCYLRRKTFHDVFLLNDMKFCFYFENSSDFHLD